MFKTVIFLMCMQLLAWIVTAAAAQTPVEDTKQTIVSKQSHAENKYPSVIIYTLTTCPHCMEAKQYLKDHHIPFINREVDMDEAHMTDLMSIYDSMGVPEAKRGVPLMIIGGKIRLQGFNKEKFEAAIKEAMQNTNK